MEFQKRKICRLCLKICDTNFEAIDGITRESFEKHLSELDLTIGTYPLMCRRCAEKFSEYSHFKSRCLDTQHYIVSFINDNVIDKVNITEIYHIKKRHENIIDITEDHKVCRFCMELVESDSCIYLNNEDKDIVLINIILQKCLEELDLSITEDPVICFPCYDSLLSHFVFLIYCFETEKRIRRYCETEQVDSKEEVKLCDVLKFAPTTMLKCKDGGNRFEFIKQWAKCFVTEGSTNSNRHISNGNSRKKTKKGECKEKITNEEISSFILYINGVNFTETKGKTLIGNKEEIEAGATSINVDQGNLNSVQSSLFLPEPQESSSEELLFHCEKCSFNTKCKNELKKHILSHANATTAQFHAADVHVLSLDYPAVTTVHRCPKCSYENEDKDNVKTHMDVHQNQCDSFSTKYNDSHERHQLTHKDSLENSTHTYNNCSFQTNIKKDLRRHMIVHKDNSEVTMYKCDTCSFQTRHKNNLNSHNMRSHKGASDIKMHKCESCSFATKYKRNMKRHKATHKAVRLGHDGTFKCELCRYETRQERYLKTHKLKHKLTFELTVHQCDVCSYETTRIDRLRQHMIVHKDASEVATYTCESCPFKSKYKHCYERHMLTHKSSSETKMYRCIRFSTCCFQTKHKNNLKTHNMRFHRDALEGVTDD